MIQRRTYLERSTKPLTRGPVKSVNRTRRNREWLRAFGSAERVEFVRSLPCIAAHARDCDGDVENTHTVGGGMGRRSDAENIVPCCRRHHHEMHSVGAAIFAMHRAVNLRACAAETEAAWLAYQGRVA